MADAPDSAFGMGASPGERLVLVLLWRFAPAGEREPVVWPSSAKIAEITGFGDRAVRKILARLTARGVISRCSRPSSAKRSGLAWRLHPGRRDRADGTGPTGPWSERTEGPPDHTTRAERPSPPGPVGPPIPGPTGPPEAPIEAPLESPVEAPSVPATAETTRPRKRTAAKRPSPDAIAIAQDLYDAIREHSPDFCARMDPRVLERKLRGWAKDLDLAIRLDGMTRKGAREAIDAAHRRDDDTFWRGNVLSGAKLRKHYEALRARALRRAPRRSVTAEPFDYHAAGDALDLFLTKGKAS